MALDPRYAEYADKLSLQMGVDPAITRHVLALETNGDPHAVSRAGAMGLMQLMPTTGAALGLRGADFFDPYKNIYAGVSNLAQLSRQYQGDPTSVLIGYNAGPRWANDLRSGKIQFAQLPRETQSYVQRYGNGAIPAPTMPTAAPREGSMFAPLSPTGIGNTAHGPTADQPAPFAAAAVPAAPGVAPTGAAAGGGASSPAGFTGFASYADAARPAANLASPFSFGIGTPTDSIFRPA